MKLFESSSCWLCTFNLSFGRQILRISFSPVLHFQHVAESWTSSSILLSLSFHRQNLRNTWSSLSRLRRQRRYCLYEPGGPYFLVLRTQFSNFRCALSVSLPHPNLRTTSLFLSVASTTRQRRRCFMRLARYLLLFSYQQPPSAFAVLFFFHPRFYYKEERDSSMWGSSCERTSVLVWKPYHLWDTSCFGENGNSDELFRYLESVCTRVPCGFPPLSAYAEYDKDIDNSQALDTTVESFAHTKNT